MADIECSDINCGGITEFMDPYNFGSEIRKTYEIISSCEGENNCMPRDKNGNTITRLLEEAEAIQLKGIVYS